MIDHERDPSRFCYCDECRGDGRREATEVHDPRKPTDTSKAAHDARLAGLITFFEGLRPYMAAVAAAKAWGVDDPEPVAV